MYSSFSFLNPSFLLEGEKKEKGLYIYVTFWDSSFFSQIGSRLSCIHIFDAHSYHLYIFFIESIIVRWNRANYDGQLGYFFIKFLASQTLNVARQIRPSCEIRLKKYFFYSGGQQKTIFFQLFPNALTSMFWNIFFQKIFSVISTSLALLHDNLQTFPQKNEVSRDICLNKLCEFLCFFQLLE